MLEFKDKDVAEKYTSTFKSDPVVHYPGAKSKNGFKVNLSKITLEQADRIFAMKNQNLLQLKTDAAENQQKKDYTKLSDRKLTAELTTRNIEIPEGTNREGLISLLQASDVST